MSQHSWQQSASRRAWIAGVAGLGLAVSPAAVRACSNCGDAGCLTDALMASLCTGDHSSHVAVAAAEADFALAQSLGGVPAKATTTVNVYDFDFSANAPGGAVVDPTIAVGDTVTWLWVTGFHSVTSVAGSQESFNSGDLFGSGPTFSHTFTKPGVYTYYCDIHGGDGGNGTAFGMSGTITVLAPEPATLAGVIGFGGLLVRRRMS